MVADTRVIDKEQLSYRQVTAENAVKHDLVISAYKPADRDRGVVRDRGRRAQTARGRSCVSTSPASPSTEGVRGQGLVVRERQADRIYERMVGYHVARNTLVPMTAAEFYAGLEQRFPVRDGMYFLPDQVEDYERFRITFKELAAQELFIRDESTAVQWLRQLLKDRPRTFADIQPLFMRELQIRRCLLGGPAGPARDAWRRTSSLTTRAAGRCRIRRRPSTSTSSAPERC